ncbi:MAG TPA: YciI family protein [Povalibacter sp.]|uniref:YciI family protein n=1 Tax=Povalibacter sp. TaxID=1962978 RepID=UPI002B8F3FE3|nr:YciI family protein [Povalibacter sp.]HMN44132.1 YciI family protein [Povalibacter sp.]
MADTKKFSEYLILSRGRWDEDLPQERIQQAIDDFYEWHAGLVASGRAKPGQRLAEPTMLVSRDGVIDGPFAETKEVIGGYWFFLAESLADAAALAGKNPCVACGLTFEVRPVEPERCSAYAQTNETPLKRRAVS